MSDSRQVPECSQPAQLTPLPCREGGQHQGSVLPSGHAQWTCVRRSQQCPGQAAQTATATCTSLQAQGKAESQNPASPSHWDLQQADRVWREQCFFLEKARKPVGWILWGKQRGSVTALTAIGGCHRLIYCFPSGDLYGITITVIIVIYYCIIARFTTSQKERSITFMVTYLCSHCAQG